MQNYLIPIWCKKKMSWILFSQNSIIYKPIRWNFIFLIAKYQFSSFYKFVEIREDLNHKLLNEIHNNSIVSILVIEFSTELKSQLNNVQLRFVRILMEIRIYDLIIVQVWLNTSWILRKYCNVIRRKIYCKRKKYRNFRRST